MSRKYRIAGNFRGRKLSRFFSHPQKFSPRNSRHAKPIMLPFHESFLREMLLSTDLRKFFPSKISRYMVRGRLELWLIQVCMTNAKCLSGQSPHDQLLLPLQIQCKFIIIIIITVEPPNKGRFGNGPLVLCSEVVPISEVHDFSTHFDCIILITS